MVFPVPFAPAETVTVAAPVPDAVPTVNASLSETAVQVAPPVIVNVASPPSAGIERERGETLNPSLWEM